MSSSRTLLRKLRTSFTCTKLRFDPSIILLYIAVFVEQYCDITQVNALPENEGILEPSYMSCCESRSKEPSLEVLLVLHNRIWKLASASPGEAEDAGQY